MTISPLDDLGRLLDGAAGTTTGGTLPPPHDGPRVDVDDFGELRPPLTPARLRVLLRQAVRAPYGKGDLTLVDRSVRDTWQITSDVVTIDWEGRLETILDHARRTLGLPPTCRLRAEFQSLLVYERGQFFLPHQDSQKSDDMVASLVVMLPSPGTGGELVVDEGPQATTYVASRTDTTLVAFYADRRHEVRPVRSGHRIVLTYNLLISGDSRARDTATDVVDAAAALLEGYFTTPRSTWGEPARTPTRLAYLLDHEYVERGLDARRLKGSDADAAATLAAAAERADCELQLALVEVHEGHDEDDLDGEPIDADITVTHWVTPGGGVEPTNLTVGTDEVAGTPSRWLQPYDCEYEGYQGNYGNTMDRWYRRAALLVWPRRLAFAQRCDVAPATAVRELLARLAEGDGAQVRLDLAGVLPSWADIVPVPFGASREAQSERDELLTLTMMLAAQLHDAETAGRLLAPFRIEQVRPQAMAPLDALAQRYGGPWVRQLLHSWATDARGVHPRGADDEWLAELPDLIQAAPHRSGPAGEVLTLAWARLRQRIEDRAAAPSTSAASEALADLGRFVAALLEAATECGANRLRDEVLSGCRRAELVDLGVVALDTARAWSEPLRQAAEIGLLREFVLAGLQERVDAPSRAADDWSLQVEAACGCELCATLDAFLADPGQRQLDWPLAKQGRQHIHYRIDRAELPVSHVTRRTGRPFTLVLMKTHAVFDRETWAREQARADLARLRDEAFR